MAREGGKSGDVGTKQDQPSEQAGKGTPAKEELETKKAAQTSGRAKKGSTKSADPGVSGAEAAEAPQAKAATRRRKKPAEPEAEGTAAAESGVDKAAAEAVAEEKPKPRRRTAAKPKADEAEAPAAEAADEGEEGTPAQRRRRGSRGRGGRGAGAAAAEAEVAEATATEEPAAEAEAATEPPAAPAARPRRTAPSTDGARPVVRAQAKYVRTSARKARLVCEHIRGKSVDEARAILAFTPRAAARDWSKVLESAIANAENNHELVGDDLRVLAAYADEGPTLKRYRPRAMGRATRIRKRTSHLTIQLTPKEGS